MRIKTTVVLHFLLLCHIHPLTSATHKIYGQMITGVYCRNLDFETENLSFNSVNVYYESQIFMLTKTVDTFRVSRWSLKRNPGNFK